jgi:hypothetical protein
MSSNEEKGTPINEGRKERSRRIRNKPEAILVKVEEGKEWLQIYKEVVVAKEVLKESAGVRKTRNEDVLIELKSGIKGSEIAFKLNEAIGDKVPSTRYKVNN